MGTRGVKEESGKATVAPLPVGPQRGVRQGSAEAIVIPARAGIQKARSAWTPACAGATAGGFSALPQKIAARVFYLGPEPQTHRVQRQEQSGRVGVIINPAW